MAPLKEVNDTVYKIIGSCMDVHKTLGPGYPVDFYKKSLEVEFKERELVFEMDKELPVTFKKTTVGQMPIDFFVTNSVAVMLRAQEDLKDIEIQQVLRVMALTETKLGLLVNFGNIKIQYKRVLPSRQSKDIRRDPYRLSTYREMGRTREENPAF